MDTSRPNTHIAAEAAPTERRTYRVGWGLAFVGVFILLGMLAIGLRRSTEGPIVVGDKVPNFTFYTFDDDQIQLSDLEGKVVVLNFWASWCLTCEQEARDLQIAWEMYGPRGDVVFLGADYVDTEPEAMKYLQRYNITYINGPDLGTRLSQVFKLRGVPETYIIDKEGRLANMKIGPYRSLAEIQGMIEPLLSQ